jgi:hypothetical protein
MRTIRRYFPFLALLMFLAMSSEANGKDGPDSASPALTVDQALNWLPVNTETIIVAQGPFELQPVEAAEQNAPLDRMLQTFACVPVAWPAEMTPIKSLKGLHVVVEITVEVNGEKTKPIFVLVFLAALGHGIYI